MYRMEIQNLTVELQNKVFYFMSHPCAEMINNAKVNDAVILVKKSDDIIIFNINGVKWYSPEIYESYVHHQIRKFKEKGREPGIY